MLKSSKKLIGDYISNTNLSEEERKKLENNEEFMRDVIIETDDYDYFRKCSYGLKINFNFVLFVIEKFIYNEEFISGVLLNFFANTVDNQKSREFRIMLSKLYEKYQVSYLEQYQYLARKIYEYEKQMADDKMSELNNSWVVALGMGFRLMAEFNFESDIIRKYLAEQMINDILGEIDIEKDIHISFLSASK